MRAQGEPGEAVEQEPAAVRTPWAPGQERIEGAGGPGSRAGAGGRTPGERQVSEGYLCGRSRISKQQEKWAVTGVDIQDFVLCST